MCWFYYTTVLTFYSLHPVYLVAQDCIPAGDLRFYEITSMPTLNPFTNSSSTLGPSCSLNPSTSVWECFPNNPLPVLIDGQLGQVQSPPNASSIHAWSRSQQQTVTITFQYSSATQVRHIRLYFYHVPSMGIGLPDIAITAGASQSYYVTGNQNLRSTDAQRRMIVLSFVQTLVIASRYDIQFTFGASSIVDWLLLSEVEMCAQPNVVLTPNVAPALLPTIPVVHSSDNVSPNLTLSCTVSGEGRFRWEWSGPQNPEKVWSSDFTRTSTAEFTGIRGLTSADTGYSCRATYNPTIVGGSFNMSVSKNLDILLDFAISTTTANVIVPIGGIVSLSCEASGYLPGSIPDFAWFNRNNTVQLNNGSIYSITNMEGNGTIQNGGSSSVPSIVSQLSFVVNTFLENEPFVCLFQGRLIVLLVSTTSLISETDEITATLSSKTTVTLSSKTTVTLSSKTTAEELANKSFSVILIATIPTVIIILIAIVAIVCTIVAVIYRIYRRRKQSSLSDQIYDLPSDKDVETVIMNKSVAYGVVTEAQESFDMSLSNTYEL